MNDDDDKLVPRPPDKLKQPELLEGRIVPRAGAGADPLEAFRARCSPSSWPTMHARLNVAASILQPRATAETFPWATLDHVAVSQVLRQLADAKASPATQNITRAALRKMAKVLFGLRLMSVEERQRIDDLDAARGKRLPRGRALSQKEIRKLFIACARDSTPAGRRDAALVAVLYGTGLRRMEARSLDAADVDLKRRLLRVEGKGGQQKLQPFPALVAMVLQAWLDARGDWDGPLFVPISKAGRLRKTRLNAHGNTIPGILNKRGAQAGLESVSPHDFRRTFATTLLDMGEDLATVAKLLRHASITTTSIYDRRNEKKAAEAVAKLPVPFDPTT